MNIAELERQRIGQDLHDGLGQNLTAVTFLIEALKEKMDGQSGKGIQDIENIESLVSNAIVQTRNLSRMLSPVEMEKNGLRLALDDMAAATEKVYHVSCKVYQNGNFFISENQAATHLFYIAREAVTNSIKHGKAENIIINLIADESGLTMVIRDNGAGAGVQEKGIGIGLGLRIMKYRAAVVGADFSAGNRDKGGFEVIVRLRAAQPRPDEPA
jgi:two-component system sensor kinase FixL